MNEKEQEKIYKKISKCSNCTLRKDVPPDYKNVPHDFYGSLGNAPKYMFIMQNPGTSRQKKFAESYPVEIEKACDVGKKMGVMRKFFLKWMRENNQEFSEKFCKLLQNKKLIEFDGEWKKYLDEDPVKSQFFKDFYVTDLVKCRTNTEKINKSGENAEKCFDCFLREEIESVSPKLIFAFSKRTWGVLKRKLNCELVEHNWRDGDKSDEDSKEEAEEAGEDLDENSEKNGRVTDTHGKLYKTNKIVDTYLIPLLFFSNQGLSRCPRESYFVYLEEGLEVFNNIKNYTSSTHCSSRT